MDDPHRESFLIGEHQLPGDNASEPLDPLDPQAFQRAHNLIKAHARAYRLYRQDFSRTQHGTVTSFNFAHILVV